ncbi:hypothetical protein ACFZDK_53515 [Streptomyces sp. NPDC007901]|uniref:hypothetical protein n=1 Tax=Streptomyces sp. NPDC007901 TaxID=3364785 RepID=UPI0036E5162A
MIERHEIENDLLGEIADHFTSCGDDQSSYAGLVIDRVRHEQGSVVLTGYERASHAVHRGRMRTGDRGSGNVRLDFCRSGRGARQ